MAVPKKKRSYSKKHMRQKNSFFFLKNYKFCLSCSKIKLLHHKCLFCSSKININ